MSAPTAAILDELGRRVRLTAQPQECSPDGWAEFRTNLFSEQLALCDSTDRQNAAKTPRRAGKSSTAAALLFDAGHKWPRAAVVYLHPDGGARAAETMLGTDINLERLARRFRLPWRLDRSTKTLHNTRNGSAIYIRGADDYREIKKTRGFKTSRAVLDEAQSFPPGMLREILTEHLGPSLTDLRGQVYLLGTPGKICREGDLWYDLTRNESAESRAKRVKGWRVFEWLALDNPHVRQQVAEEIAGKLEAIAGHPRAETLAHLLDGGAAGFAFVVELARLADPALLREYFGFWAQDGEGAVYAFKDERDSYGGTLPRGHTWRFVLGGDLGMGDAYAHVVLAVAPTHPVVYEVETFKQRGLHAGQQRARYDAARRQYNPVRCLLDTGGLGAAIAAEWQEAGIPVEAAEKAGKLAFIALLNGDLKEGKAKVLAGGEVAREWAALQRKPRSKETVYEVTGDDHAADGYLYAYRVARTLAGKEDRPAPELTPLEAREKREIDALRRTLEAQEMREKSLTSALRGARFAGGRR